MAERRKILIADSDLQTAESLRTYLNAELFDAKIVPDGSSVLREFQAFAPDLILLETTFPDADGYQICRELRRSSAVPIIMLSARGDVFDKVLALELGADDYIVKPFDHREVSARIRAVLRRLLPLPAALPKSTGKYVEYPDLIISLTNYSVICRGEIVEMPPKELELLYFLAASPNQVFTREQLLDQLWGYEYVGDTRTVDVHIKRLREKIRDHEQWAITTVWGIGYKFATTAMP